MGKIILTDEDRAENGFSEPIEQRPESNKSESEVESKSESESNDLTTTPSHPNVSIYDARWTPDPTRKILDLELMALINVSVGYYVNNGLLMDDPLEMESFIDQQLERFQSFMSIAQIEFYRLKVTENLFAVGLSHVTAKVQRDQGQINQIANELNKRSKKNNHRH